MFHQILMTWFKYWMLFSLWLITASHLQMSHEPLLFFLREYTLRRKPLLPSKSSRPPLHSQRLQLKRSDSVPAPPSCYGGCEPRDYGGDEESQTAKETKINVKSNEIGSSHPCLGVSNPALRWTSGAPYYRVYEAGKLRRRWWCSGRLKVFEGNCLKAACVLCCGFRDFTQPRWPR